MPTRAHHLRLVSSPGLADRRAAPEPGDLALLAALFAVNLVPVAGEIARAGRWGAGTVGAAAAGALLAGRELLFEMRALLRARR